MSSAPQTNSGVWVSELNRDTSVRPRLSVPAPIRFYDTTLRDGEQTVGVVLSPEQKLDLAHHIDSLGISRIEAGLPRVSVEDAEAIKLISAANLKAEIWEFSRAALPDLEELVK